MEYRLYETSGEGKPFRCDGARGGAKDQASDDGRALWHWLALLVFAAVACLMMLQVRSEEKRLEADFGEEYLEYKKRTGRFITFRK